MFAHNSLMDDLGLTDPQKEDFESCDSGDITG